MGIYTVHKILVSSMLDDIKMSTAWIAKVMLFTLSISLNVYADSFPDMPIIATANDEVTYIVKNNSSYDVVLDYWSNRSTVRIPYSPVQSGNTSVYTAKGERWSANWMSVWLMGKNLTVGVVHGYDNFSKRNYIHWDTDEVMPEKFGWVLNWVGENKTLPQQSMHQIGQGQGIWGRKANAYFDAYKSGSGGSVVAICIADLLDTQSCERQ